MLSAQVRVGVIVIVVVVGTVAVALGVWFCVLDSPVLYRVRTCFVSDIAREASMINRKGSRSLLVAPNHSD